MNDEASNGRTEPSSNAVGFGLRLASSDGFKMIFREGMGLVEETASYLDGPGREQSRDLPRAASLTYATESMRLTTRLMQLASWLLLQRAVNEGEMTQDQAGQEKSKVRIDHLSSSRHGPGWDELPGELKTLVERSMRLQERIRLMDDAIYSAGKAKSEDTAANPVISQLSQIARAFGTDR